VFYTCLAGISLLSIVALDALKHRRADAPEALAAR